MRPYGEISTYICRGGYYPPALNSIHHKNGRSMNAPTDRLHYSSVGGDVLDAPFLRKCYFTLKTTHPPQAVPLP